MLSEFDYEILFLIFEEVLFDFFLFYVYYYELTPLGIEVGLLTGEYSLISFKLSPKFENI